MTARAIEALCREWQERLGLLDWNVRIRFARPWEIENGALGQCDSQIQSKTAAIRILHPSDMQPDPDFPEFQSIEHTVIHELLHLHCAYFAPPGDDLRHDMFEHMLNRLAEGLSRLNSERLRAHRINRQGRMQKGPVPSGTEPCSQI